MSWREPSVFKLVKSLWNITYQPAPVGVIPPFIFVVAKENLNSCSNDSCFYASCWNATEYSYAMILRILRWIPMQVEVGDALILHRQKRDFGVTVAIVTAIAIAAREFCCGSLSITWRTYSGQSETRFG